jgi:hypothetical protein
MLRLQNASPALGPPRSGSAAPGSVRARLNGPFPSSTQSPGEPSYDSVYGQCLLDAEFLAWLQMMTELAQRHFEAALAAEQDAQGKTSLLCRVQNYG